MRFADKTIKMAALWTTAVQDLKTIFLSVYTAFLSLQISQHPLLCPLVRGLSLCCGVISTVVPSPTQHASSSLPRDCCSGATLPLTVIRKVLVYKQSRFYCASREIHEENTHTHSHERARARPQNPWSLQLHFMLAVSQRNVPEPGCVCKWWSSTELGRIVRGLGIFPGSTDLSHASTDGWFADGQ